MEEAERVPLSCSICLLDFFNFLGIIIMITDIIVIGFSLKELPTSGLMDVLLVDRLLKLDILYRR